MSARVYLRPLSLPPGARVLDGAAVRLGGSRAWASQFALIRREGGRIVSRAVVGADGMAGALARLPADLAVEGMAQWAALRATHPPLVCGGQALALDRPRIMGILNTTPDSFSDGGAHLADPAAHGRAMLAAGADIIDIGGESTRPGAAPVAEDEEIARVIPAVRALAADGAAISLDTRRVGVMRAGLAAGGHILNDVSALREKGALAFAAASGAPVVLMHAPGEGDDLHTGGAYGDVLLDVFDWLRVRRDAARAAGVARIILDPGIGFGKSLADNLALMAGLELFHALGCPLLVGASRKRMIAALSADEGVGERLGGSLALALRALDAGVHILRVHDVAETMQATRVWQAMAEGEA